MELKQLVAAGLTPMQEIHAATGGAAQILGAERELGTIAVGKWADLVFLDADPFQIFETPDASGTLCTTASSLIGPQYGRL